MKLKNSKIVTGGLLVFGISLAIIFGLAKGKLYEGERTTIEALFPAVQLKTWRLDINDFGIVKRIIQPRKLYLRIRHLKNNSQNVMRLKFTLSRGDKKTKFRVKIESKPFDLKKDIFVLEPGKEAGFNLYLTLSKESYQKGRWDGKLVIKDEEQGDKIVGVIPIEIINSGRS